MSKEKEEASPDVKTVEDVLNLPGNSQLKFGLLIGLIEVGQVADNDVVDTVLNLLVGAQFDLEKNFIIQEPESITHMVELLEHCTPKLQAEIWSVFIAMVRKSKRNSQACTEVELINYVLNRLPEADDVVADLLIDLLGALASYSITVKELKVLFTHLKARNGKWARHSVKLLSVLRQMPQRHGPDEFFSFPGKKGSAIALPPIRQMPYQNGWTFSTWFRLDPVTGVSIEREKPYLYCFRTGKGIGYSGHFLGNALVITAMKIKGKGFQHCVKFDFLPRKWYMVSIVHIYNRWSKSELRCYVDGALVSQTDMSWFVNSSDPFDKCFIGASSENEVDSMFCGQMSTLYMFSEALTPQQVQAVHQLGPGYKNQFRFENECNNVVAEPYRRVLYEAKLTHSMVFMYNPIACDSQLCLESSPKGNPSFFVHSPHALMLQDVKAVITHSIHSTLHSLGGIQVLFPLFGQLDCTHVAEQGAEEKVDYSICASLMALLGNLLESSTTIQQQLLQNKGFLVISHLLEKSSREHINGQVLGSFLKLTNFLVAIPSCAPLLKHLFDHILFNPALWIYTSVDVQNKLYSYLATEFINDAQIYTNIRRVSAVLQTMHSLKYYYWIVNPKDRSGIMPKGVDGPRPSREETVKLRSYMLLYIKQLILKGQGINDDELQAILNYLTTMHEDDNLRDVLQFTVVLMAEHPASMVPAFDRKHGVRTVFKLLASANENIRITAMKLLGFFLMRSTHKRKHDGMNPYNLFSLLAERLMLNSTQLTLRTYNVLYEVMTERMNSKVIEDRHPEPDSNYKLENPMVLKVIATLIRQSKQTEKVMEVKKLFLSDLTILCIHNRENRRTVLQMSVWQDWLFSMCYIYPRNQEEQRVTEMVMALFKMLLHHAIKFEFGGWRVWIDTLAILHSKVAYEDFKIHMNQMYQQYERQRVDGITDPNIRQQFPISTISGLQEEQTSPDRQAKSTVEITEIQDTDEMGASADGVKAIKSQKKEAAASADNMSERPVENGEADTTSAQEETKPEATPSDPKMERDEAYNVLGMNDIKEVVNEIVEGAVDSVEVSEVKDSKEGQGQQEAEQKEEAAAEKDGEKKDAEQTSVTVSTGDNEAGDAGAAKVEDAKEAENEEKKEASSEKNDAVSKGDSSNDTVSTSASPAKTPATSGSGDGEAAEKGEADDIVFPMEGMRPRSNSTGGIEQPKPDLHRGRPHSMSMRQPSSSAPRQIFSPGPRAPPFRIPEFRWSYLHQKLLSDLLFSIETDVQVWKSHSTKTVIDFVNAADNHVFVVNVIHMISQLSDNLVTACGGLLPLLAAATSPNCELDMLEPSQGLSIEQSVSFLQRVMNLTDILVFASSTNFGELEQEKNMSSGGILRQCLRLVCTCAVRNCLECRHRSMGRTPASTPTHANEVRTNSFIQSLICGTQPSSKNIVENLGGQNSPIKDIEKLLQDMDINRLRAVVYRDVEETKQAQFLALAIVYFVSVLMVSKYRDILEPPSPARTPLSTPARSVLNSPASRASGEHDYSGRNHVSNKRDNGKGSDYIILEDDDSSVLAHMSAGNTVVRVPKKPDDKIDDKKNLSEYEGSENNEPQNQLDTSGEIDVTQVEVAVDLHRPPETGEAEETKGGEQTVGEAAEGNVDGGQKEEREEEVKKEEPEGQVDAEEAEAPAEGTSEGPKVEEEKTESADQEEEKIEADQSEDSKAEADQDTSKDEEKSEEKTDERPETVEDKPEGATTTEEEKSNENQSDTTADDETTTAAAEDQGPEGEAPKEAQNGAAEEKEQTEEKQEEAKPDVSSDAASEKADEPVSSSEKVVGAEASAAPQENGTDAQAEELDEDKVHRRDSTLQKEDSVDQPKGIAAIAVGNSAETENRPNSLDLTSKIPSPLENLPPPEEGGSLTDRLERALGSASPLLREIFVDFAPFLSKTLLGSHGQELLIGGLVTLKQSTSVVELVMLLCSQEWQNSLQKHAGLAFIELVNEGRLLAHATRDHIVRVANEAEFILNRMRAEDVQKHAEFESACAQTLLERKEEEKLCDHLITSARQRDHVIASKVRDKIVNIMTNKHGAWGSPKKVGKDFWKLDTWEDDSRRRRRLVKNSHGSTHPEATLKAAIEHGATEDAINQAREAFHSHLAATQKSQNQQPHDTTEEELSQMNENEADMEFAGPVALSTPCNLIAPGVVVRGTMSITKSELYFELDEDCPENKKIDTKVLSYVEYLHGKWHFTEIRAIFSRRYLLQNIAIELFMANRSAVMFSFPDHTTVKKVINALPRVGVGIKYGLPQARRTSMASPKNLFKMSNMTQKWQRREISNFDYLMYLNTIAGRSYNDLNQYPVFPWVIVNYDSNELDLSLPSNYRDLSKPIGALNPTRKAFFEERFASWEHEQIPPFHYGTHYSTAAFTLNWLIRVEPFTSMFLNLQGGKFDHANRTFHSIAQSWKNCQRDTSDVKELLPEFYYLPEMFTNSNKFNFGQNEEGNVVDGVELPRWASSAQEFVRLNRMALESEFVSCQLHQWIDLIFGYKQRGPEAVRATNVFYYLTYEGSVNLDAMTDRVMREAVENQIRSFGQTPSQLLTEPHPPRSSAMHISPMMFSTAPDDVCMIMKFLSNSPVTHVAANTHPSVPVPAVTTITCNHNFAVNRWNQNVGSQVPSPSYAEKTDTQPQLPLSMDQLLVLGTNLHKRTLGDNFDQRLHVTNSHFLTTSENKVIIACGFWDKSFRTFSTDAARILQVIFGHFDIVTCLARSECNVSQDCYVVSGSKDCTAMVWLWSSKHQAIVGENGSLDNPTPKVTLTGHQAEVTCVAVSAEMGLVFTGSKNGPCLVHTTHGDLLRSLEPPTSYKCPNIISFAREGYIIVNYDSGNMATYSVNGKLLRNVEHNDNVQSLTLSRDGAYMIMGGDNGIVEVWRTHDLNLLYTYPTCDSSVRSLALSHDQKYLLAGLATGCLIVFNIDFNKWHHEFQERY
ncbi:neurobeachin-like isoform X3 [Lineus longissimus]|uniref:neurobeachin-like isoform X3 n=1 Tax=Lineus longissimus TaxID=88925 RepID=UPI00315D058D